MNNSLTDLQLSFVSYINSKKTFNLSVLKERIKWWYKTHQDLIKDRELELKAYKDFISVIKEDFLEGPFWRDKSYIETVFKTVCTECNRNFYIKKEDALSVIEEEY